MLKCYRGTTKKKQKTVTEFLTALRKCSKTRDLDGGKRLHVEAIETGCHTNKHVATALITMYTKCSSMHHARDVFNSVAHRDVVFWNCLITGYVENGESWLAIELFSNMDCASDSYTYVAAIRACVMGLRLEKGMVIHRHARERAFDTHVYVANALVDMYSKCGVILYARYVFDSMLLRDVVSWNTLILGYVENGESSLAMELFSCMELPPDSFTYVAILKACSEKNEHYLVAIHEEVREKELDGNVYVANTLVDMYSKYGKVCSALEVFEGMPLKTAVTWTTLILGYLEKGESLKSIELFMNMDCEPDSYTYVAVLKACGHVAAEGTGRGIHGRICCLGLEDNQVITSCLVDFYSKCGSMPAAQHVMYTMECPDIVAWSALVAGYSLLGDTLQMFGLVKDIQDLKIDMNGITYLHLITACNHLGMVEEGKTYFIRMCIQGVIPSVEHYNCMVDMLGRANRLDEALSFVNEMPFKANYVTWTALLGACKKWKNVEVGNIAFDALVACNPHDSAAYVLMSDV